MARFRCGVGMPAESPNGISSMSDTDVTRTDTQGTDPRSMDVEDEVRGLKTIDAMEAQERPVAEDSRADVNLAPADYTSMHLSELTNKARDLHALLDERRTKPEAMIRETGVWTR